MVIGERKEGKGDINMPSLRSSHGYAGHMLQHDPIAHKKRNSRVSIHPTLMEGQLDTCGRETADLSLSPVERPSRHDQLPTAHRLRFCWTSSSCWHPGTRQCPTDMLAMDTGRLSTTSYSKPCSREQGGGMHGYKTVKRRVYSTRSDESEAWRMSRPLCHRVSPLRTKIQRREAWLPVNRHS